MGAKSSKKYNVTSAGAHSANSGDAGPQWTSAASPPAQQQPISAKSAETAAVEKSESADVVETVVCKVDDMKNGQMKEVELDGKKILLIKDGDQFFAVGSKCSHYGAPLAKGAYCKGVVRCPWHGACFNVGTGDIEDFPGLDSLPKFETKIENDEVSVRADRSVLAKSKRVKKMCTLNPDLAETHGILIVGGGAAAVSCAETLRQEGFGGRIRIFTQESNLPYDRPKISKGLDIEVSNIYMRSPEFYEEYGIEIITGAKVVKLDPSAESVTLADGRNVNYETLVIATGGTPRELTCPGADLTHVMYLRTPEDGAEIAKLSEGKNVVVIGSSFIGMELAACMRPKNRQGANVTVIGREDVPLQPVFGQTIGAALRKLHESNGIKFHMNSGVKELRGTDGVLTEVVLTDDTVIPADLCVVGIGVVPSTEFLQGSGIEMTDRGLVSVDWNMRTNLHGVYACGDMVVFPLSSFESKLCNVQHWQMALKHGKTAALAISGKESPIRTVPFFWSVMFGKSIRYTGLGQGYDDIVMKGDVDDLKFEAYYLKSDIVVAVATLGRDPVAAIMAELFRLGRKITKNDVLK